MKPARPLSLAVLHMYVTLVKAKRMLFRIRRDVVLTVLGLIVGWGISHFYYAKSINDMKADVEERKRVEQLVLRGIESYGTIKYNRDSEGHISGIVIELKANIAGQSNAPKVSHDVDKDKKISGAEQQFAPDR